MILPSIILLPLRFSALQSVQITHFVEDFLCVRKSRRLYFPAINFPAILFCDFCAFSRLSRVWLRLRRAVLLRVSAFTRCFLLGRGFAALRPFVHFCAILRQTFSLCLTKSE